MGKIKNIIYYVLITFCFILFNQSESGAAILEVWPDQTPNSTPIQGAIDDASTGDVIIVHCGNYPENITFKGKAITVRSDGDGDPSTYDISPTKTIIEGGERIVTFTSGEQSDSIIDGFTLRNGKPGIDVLSSSNPTVRNCIFASNSAGGGAGGSVAYNASATFFNCLFIDNNAGGGGGFEVVDSSSVTMINCTFSNNSANTGGGLNVLNSSSATLVNCIFWENNANVGHEIAIAGNSTVTISYSDIQGGSSEIYIESGSVINWDGNTNFNSDPFFICEEDYQLTKNSPCIDKGNNETPDLHHIDLGGMPRIIDGDNNKISMVDMGAFEFGTPQADLDGDGDVDGDDLKIFSERYGTYKGP